MNTLEGRYSRQELFPPIGPVGQQRIRRALILVTGCGGLGSNTASILARAGVGSLRIVDRDIIELSNLHRQSLFEESDVSEHLPKAVAASRHITRINSDVQVEALAADVSSENVLDLLDRVDLAVDGFDNFEGRYLLNDACVKVGVPWVYGSCIGSTAMVGLIVPGKTACFRCLHRDLPPPGAAETCDTAGIVGPAAFLAAAMQSSLALQFLLHGTVEGTLVSADAWDLRIERLPMPPRDSNCPCCGLGRYDFLEAAGRPTTVLCGRGAVQVRSLSSGRLDFVGLAERLHSLGTVRVNEFLLRFHAPPYELTIFPDGRMIVKGTDDEALARTLISRWIGA
jgi:molybdopterin-synthase adenylyltransferase